MYDLPWWAVTYGLYFFAPLVFMSQQVFVFSVSTRSETVPLVSRLHIIGGDVCVCALFGACDCWTRPIFGSHFEKVFGDRLPGLTQFVLHTLPSGSFIVVAMSLAIWNWWALGASANARQRAVPRSVFAIYCAAVLAIVPIALMLPYTFV